jgi:hypothetical protein
MGSGERHFRVGEVALLLDVSVRRVEGWVEQGFLKPSIPGRGAGKPHWFSWRDVALAVLLLELQRAFGAKSPIVARVFPDVAGAAHDLALDERGKGPAIFAISRRGEDETRVAFLPLAQLNHFTIPELQSGYVVTIVSVTAVLARFAERLKELSDSAGDAE